MSKAYGDMMIDNTIQSTIADKDYQIKEDKRNNIKVEVKHKRKLTASNTLSTAKVAKSKSKAQIPK